MNITAAAVDQLRKRTGMQMMKRGRVDGSHHGDMEKAAVEILRKARILQDKVVNRETAEGRIGVFIDVAQQIGAIVEVRCESAPVAKSDLFVKLANGLAKQIAVKDPPSVAAHATLCGKAGTYHQRTHRRGGRTRAGER